MMTDQELAELKSRCVSLQGSGFFVAKAEDLILQLIDEVQGYRQQAKAQTAPQAEEVVEAADATQADSAPAKVEAAKAPKKPEPKAVKKATKAKSDTSDDDKADE
jgi:hypothetical protein